MKYYSHSKHARSVRKKQKSCCLSLFLIQRKAGRERSLREQVAAGFPFFTLCCTRTLRIWKGRGIDRHSWGRSFFLRIMLCRGGGCCPEQRIWRWRGQR